MYSVYLLETKEQRAEELYIYLILYSYIYIDFIALILFASMAKEFLKYLYNFAI